MLNTDCIRLIATFITDGTTYKAFIFTCKLHATSLAQTHDTYVKRFTNNLMTIYRHIKVLSSNITSRKFQKASTSDTRMMSASHFLQVCLMAASGMAPHPCSTAKRCHQPSSTATFILTGIYQASSGGNRSHQTYLLPSLTDLIKKIGYESLVLMHSLPTWQQGSPQRSIGMTSIATPTSLFTTLSVASEPCGRSDGCATSSHHRQKNGKSSSIRLLSSGSGENFR